MTKKKTKKRTLRGVEMKYPVSSTRSCKIVGSPGFARVNLSDVKQCARACSSHWFDADTLRFFKSRVDDTAYVDGKGGAYFVSSERYDSSHPRLYSVNHYAKCSIDTVGQFQGYKTKLAATKAIKGLIGEKKFHPSELKGFGRPSRRRK